VPSGGHGREYQGEEEGSGDRGRVPGIFRLDITIDKFAEATENLLRSYTPGTLQYYDFFDDVLLSTVRLKLRRLFVGTIESEVTD